MRQPVVACCNAAEVLEPVECAFDLVSGFIDGFIEREWLCSVAFVWNNRLRAALCHPSPQGRAVVSFICEKMFRRRFPADQLLRGRAVMRVAARQEKAAKAAFIICECVYLRIAPAA